MTTRKRATGPSPWVYVAAAAGVAGGLGVIYAYSKRPIALATGQRYRFQLYYRSREAGIRTVQEAIERALMRPNTVEGHVQITAHPFGGYLIEFIGVHTGDSRKLKRGHVIADGESGSLVFLGARALR